METLPKLQEYVNLITQLFAQFEQQRLANKEWKQGRPFTYTEQVFIVFFLLMQFRKIYEFKAQYRWLVTHDDMLELLGWATAPHRTTISRRYKALYETIQDFTLFISEYATEVDSEQFSRQHLLEDKSLFKAAGTVWHQSDRKNGHIPEKLRNLDTDATWSKSGYHGWVYGYGLHLTCNQHGFPCLIQVETASVSESEIIDLKATIILNEIQPETLAADNGYFQAMRIRNWAKRGAHSSHPCYQMGQGPLCQGLSSIYQTAYSSRTFMAT